VLLIFVLTLACFDSAKAGEAVQRITGKSLTILRDQENVIVKQGQQLLVRYRYAKVPSKPYVAEMTSPGGVNILRDAPLDHLHHHGLMFAWRVEGVNFWEEREGCGSEVHQQWKDLQIGGEGAEQAVLREQLVWQTSDGRSLLQERRTLTILAPAEGQPRMLTWQADFTPSKDAAGPLTVDGTEYNGLGMRMIKPMDAAEGLHFNGAGGLKVAGTNGKRAPWTAYTAPTGAGGKVTVAMFDAPTNPRHPTVWFTMGEEPPFAYLSGTLGVGEEPLELKPGETISVRFGVAIFEGAVDADRVNATYLKWCR
jgi:hypothetical protein